MFHCSTNELYRCIVVPGDDTTAANPALRLALVRPMRASSRPARAARPAVRGARRRRPRRLLPPPRADRRAQRAASRRRRAADRRLRRARRVAAHPRIATARPPRYGPAREHHSEPDLESRPALRAAAPHGLRPPRRRRPRLPRLHRRRACTRESQLAEHLALLRGGVFGNPHSVNPTSAAMTELVERARAAVLEFFGASPEEYVAIFTPNATGALRLVGEAYPFRPGDRFLLTFDNHNSVNGIREFARARGAETTYVPSVAPDLRVDEALLPRYLERGRRRPPQPVRLSRAVELLRRPAPARVDRAGARARLGRAARRGRVRADEPARPLRWQARLRRALLLQDVRLADRRRLPDRPARRARASSSGRGSRAARSSPRSSSASGTSRRPAPPTSRTARSTSSTCPAVEIGLRLLDRVGIDDDPRPRRGARRAGCSRRSTALATRTARPQRRSTARRRRPARRDDRVQLPPPGRAHRRRALRRPHRPRPQHLAADRLLLQPRRRRGRVHDLAARRSSAASSATAMTLDDYVDAIGLPSGGAVRASLGLASNFADIAPVRRDSHASSSTSRRPGRPAAAQPAARRRPRRSRRSGRPRRRPRAARTPGQAGKGGCAGRAGTRRARPRPRPR